MSLDVTTNIGVLTDYGYIAFSLTEIAHLVTCREIDSCDRWNSLTCGESDFVFSWLLDFEASIE